MGDDTTLDLILRAFRVFDGFSGPASDGLWWRTDGEYAPVTLLVSCNDLFQWASAECETLTAENVGVLEATHAELLAIDRELGRFADILFCCRVRGNRPQHPYYKHIDERLHGLFDACGPRAY